MPPAVSDKATTARIKRTSVDKAKRMVVKSNQLQTTNPMEHRWPRN